VVDETGKFLANDVLYPHTSKSAAGGAADRLGAMLAKYSVSAIAIGNGFASWETDAFVRDTLRQHHLDSIFSVTVSESGASIYSASDVVRPEFPDLDLTVRGAISIARCL
jgi:protein Tex